MSVGTRDQLPDQRPARRRCAGTNYQLSEFDVATVTGLGSSDSHNTLILQQHYIFYVWHTSTPYFYQTYHIQHAHPFILGSQSSSQTSRSACFLLQDPGLPQDGQLLDQGGKRDASQ